MKFPEIPTYVRDQLHLTSDMDGMKGKLPGYERRYLVETKPTIAVVGVMVSISVLSLISLVVKGAQLVFGVDYTGLVCFVVGCLLAGLLALIPIVYERLTSLHDVSLVQRYDPVAFHLDHRRMTIGGQVFSWSEIAFVRLTEHSYRKACLVLQVFDTKGEEHRYPFDRNSKDAVNWLLGPIRGRAKHNRTSSAPEELNVMRASPPKEMQ
mgnify:CR=1 FL=1